MNLRQKHLLKSSFLCFLYVGWRCSFWKQVEIESFVGKRKDEKHICKQKCYSLPGWSFRYLLCYIPLELVSVTIYLFGRQFWSLMLIVHKTIIFDIWSNCTTIWWRIGVLVNGMHMILFSLSVACLIFY